MTRQKLTPGAPDHWSREKLDRLSFLALYGWNADKAQREWIAVHEEIAAEKREQQRRGGRER